MLGRRSLYVAEEASCDQPALAWDPLSDAAIVTYHSGAPTSGQAISRVLGVLESQESPSGGHDARAEAGVRVNAVAAGPVYTPIQPREAAEAVGAGTIMGRVAQPDEIASVIAFLASPKASYITGAVVAADGGRTAI